MTMSVEDVTSIYGSDLDIQMEEQFLKKLQRELPPAYYDRYVRNLRFEDIGYVINEFGDVMFGEIGVSGIGLEEDFGYSVPEDPFLRRKVFVPYISMAGYKKALVLNVIQIYLAGAPEPVVKAVKKALEKVKEMEIRGDIEGLELGDISGWWDGVVHAFQSAGSAIVHGAQAAGGAIVKGAKAIYGKGGVVDKAAHAIFHGAETVAKGAVWVGKKVAGAVVGGIKWMADQVKKVGTKLYNALTQKDKALKKLAEWKGVIKVYADLLQKAQREGKKISPDHATKLATHIANWKKAAKKLGVASNKLDKYKKIYQKAKKKAPVTTIASVKNAKKYLKGKGVKITHLHGTEGLDEVKVGEIGLPPVVAAAAVVAGIAAAAGIIIALIAFMNKGEQKTKSDYHQLLNEYKTSETGEYEEMNYPYDPSKDPPTGYVDVPDPTDPSKTIKALRVRDKIYLPKTTKTETGKKSETWSHNESENVGGLYGLLDKLIVFGGVMFGLYIGGQLILGVVHRGER